MTAPLSHCCTSPATSSHHSLFLQFSVLLRAACGFQPFQGKAWRESDAFPTLSCWSQMQQGPGWARGEQPRHSSDSLAAMAWRENSGENRSMQDPSSANVGCCLGGGQVLSGMPQWCGWDPLLLPHPAWEPHSSAVSSHGHPFPISQG